MIAVRQPTETEAVEHVMRSLSRDYRRTCLEYWEQHYGRQFSESVRREAVKRWEEKARKRRDTQTSAQV